MGTQSVSIHARTRGCERQSGVNMQPAKNLFQSTLAPEGASDPWWLGLASAFKMFQSTLAPEGASDAGAASAAPIYQMFQSTLAPEGASDIFC